MRETERTAHRRLGDSGSEFLTFEGVDVHFRQRGDGPIPVVFLHHFYGNAWVWRHVQSRLDDLATTLAFDRPGFGITQRPRRELWEDRNPYQREFSADLTAAFVDHLGRGPAVVVGSSAGGTIALEAYFRHPEKVRALVLMAPAITADVGPPAPLRPLLRNAAVRMAVRTFAQRATRDLDPERIASAWYDPSRATPEDAEVYRRGFTAPGWEEGLWEVMTAEPPPFHATNITKIDVPTIVISGDSDPTVRPRASEATAKLIPGARYEEIPKCGHTPHEERPEALTETLRGFLADL